MYGTFTYQTGPFLLGNSPAPWFAYGKQNMFISYLVDSNGYIISNHTYLILLYIYWLVVSTPLKDISQVGDYSKYMGNKCSKPSTRYKYGMCTTYPLVHHGFSQTRGAPWSWAMERSARASLGVCPSSPSSHGDVNKSRKRHTGK